MSASTEASDFAASPLKISLPVPFGRQWIAPSFAAFLAQHPHIRIDAHFTDRIVDVMIAAPSYLEAHGRPRVPADLKDHACLGFPSHPYWPDWMLTKDGQRWCVRIAA